MENEIERYSIVTGSSHLELAAAVEVQLREGWQPWGGVVVAEPGTLYQALVQYSGGTTFPVRRSSA